MVQLVWKILLGSIATVGSLHALAKSNQDSIDRFFMAFFRDVGRYKARKRRNANAKGLMVTLLQQDDPMEDLLLQQEDEKYGLDDLPTFTLTELYEMGNGDGEDSKLLLSLFGRVYDVSAGSKFYGPGASYEMFAGRDVTYSLCTGCRTEECLDSSVDDLPPGSKLLDEGKRWLSFFHLHDKYPLAGKLETDHLEELMKQWMEKEVAEVEQEQSENNNEEKPLMPPILQEQQ